MLLNKDEMAALRKKSETEEAMSPGGKAMDYAGMGRPAAQPMPMRSQRQWCAACAGAVASKQALCLVLSQSTDDALHLLHSTASVLPARCADADSGFTRRSAGVDGR
jgi:hypothetical protein